MRCFFNLSDGEQFLLDDTGIEVSSLEMARHETLRAIQEMSRESDVTGVDWSNWILNLTDGAGQVLHVIPIQQAIAGQDTILE
jgi:hypothetical protein